MAACEEAARTFAETVGFIRRERERGGGERGGERERERRGEREGEREGESAGSCSSHVSDVLFSFLWFHA